MLDSSQLVETHATNLSGPNPHWPFHGLLFSAGSLQHHCVVFIDWSDQCGEQGSKPGGWETALCGS